MTHGLMLIITQNITCGNTHWEKNPTKNPTQCNKNKKKLHITTRYNQSGGRDIELEKQFFMQTTKMPNKVY